MSLPGKRWEAERRTNPVPGRLAAGAVPLALLLPALLPAALPAQQVWETWHSLDSTWLVGKTRLTAHGQLRWRNQFFEKEEKKAEVGYGRLGPVVQHPVGKLLTTFGYYYHSNRGRAQTEWRDSQRLFGGFEVPVHDGRVSVTGRQWWEYFFAGSAPQYHRSRSTVRAVWNRQGWSPLTYFELFADGSGVAAYRPAAGLRRELGRAQLQLGYFLDVRRADLGGTRHAVFTILRFQWRE